MDYFRILDLNREPFSNSPEPELFFPAAQYAACLQLLELAVRLRRGLNVVIGEIGVGKSTLCRQLILRLSAQQEDRQQIETHLIMDPAFGAPREFLSTVAASLGIPVSDANETDWQVKEQIKNVLFKKGVDEKKIIVLIIDEGQNLPDFCLELLREFLNYETNEYKLLQIVIFAQPEFTQILKEHANFADRINHHDFLGPMTSKETGEMIRFRLMRAASGTPPALFTSWGLRAIHGATGGYPRKVITLCHQLILAMIIQQRAKAGWFLVRSCLQKKYHARPPKVKWTMAAAVVVLLALFLSFVWNLESLRYIYSWKEEIKPEVVVTASVSDVPHDETRMAAPPPTAPPLPSPPPMASSLPSPENKQTVTVAPEKMPDMLGQLTVRKGGSVLRMIRKIYGNDDLNRLKAVARSNPQIDDINVVRVGKKVNFPALPVNWKAPPEKIYRLQIAWKSDLRDAYSLIEHYSPVLPAAHLVPYWNSREGMVFAVLLKEGFADEAAALRAKMQLPPPFGTDADILEKWDGDTVFFAHP